VAESALPVLNTNSCCSASETACGCGTTNENKSVITINLYAVDEVADLLPRPCSPSGCGKPTALAELNSGETSAPVWH
jgi:hypothetical protein